MSVITFLWMIGQTSCSTNTDCPSGQACISGTCELPPVNQAVAACACANGEMPTCTAADGDSSGESSGQNGEWGNCTCPDGFAASLRLVFRWEPADHITYHLPDPNPTGGLPNLAISADGLEDGDVRTEIQSAFNNWTGVDCGGGLKPTLSVTPGAVFEFSQTQNFITYDETTGLPYDPKSVNAPVGPYDIQNRVWVNTAIGQAGQPWTSDPCLGAVDSSGNCSNDNLGILATTPISYAATKENILGRIYRARTVLNASQFHWRTSEDKGCAAGSNNCYDLLVTFTHELGHFMGYQHSACAASVMYGEYDTSTEALKEQLIQSDVDSLCGHGDCSTLGYPNYQDATVPALVDKTGASIDLSEAKQSRFSTCSADTDCASGGRLRCIGTTTNGTTPVTTCPSPVGTTPCAPQAYAGFCSIVCNDTTASSDCPPGEACVNNGAISYCAINRTVDACVVTTSGSGDTGDTGGGTASTTGGSAGNTSAGTGSATDTGGAFTDFCQPCTQEADCSSGNCVDLGNGSLICSAPCSSDLDCPTGASCLPNGNGFCFPTDSSSCINNAEANTRELNEECDTQDLCAPGLVCVQLQQAAVCLEYCDPNDASTSCSTDGYSCVLIDSSSGVGVCFKALAHEGDDCAVPDTSLCGLSGELICAGTAANNYQDAQCWALCGTGYPACSQSNQTCVPFSSTSDLGVCSPIAPAPCLGQVGDKCSTTDGSDCATGKCIVKGNQQACTRSCLLATASGCPENMECLDDGNSDGKGYCWPSNDQVTTPACPKNANKSGCGCHSENPSETIALSIAVLLLLKRRKKS